eukprot:3875142-Rhodomonas_salina.1
MGLCTVCGAPLQFPGKVESGKSRVRTDLDTLLFKYGLFNTLESGHLIDRYILDNVLSVDPMHISDSKLKIQ